MSKPLSELLNFWHIEDNGIMVYKDGSMGAALKIKGVDPSCKTNDEINSLTRSVENLITSLPDGVKVQFFYEVNSDVSQRLRQHKIIQGNPHVNYQKVLDFRCDSLDRLASEGKLTQDTCYLFLRDRSINLNKKSFLSSPKKLQRISFEEFEGRVSDLKNILNFCVSQLGAGNIESELVSQGEWVNLLYGFFNLDRKNILGEIALKENTLLDQTPFVDQLALSDIDSCRDYIRIGENYFKIINIGTLPESMTFAGMINFLTDLPFHFKLSQTFEILDQTKEHEKLQVARRLAASMASGANNVNDLESESKLEQIECLLRELIEGSEKLVSMCTSIIIWDECLDELKNKSYEVLKACRRLNNAEGIIETFGAKDAFLKASPGHCELFRKKKVKSTNAACLSPVFSSNTGGNEPVCLLPTKSMNLFNLSPFDKKLPNWNGLIFGGSGSGKSFSVANLMLMFYGTNPTPRIIWIDNGASSKRLLEVLGGEFVELNIDTDISINMFDLEKGQTTPSPSKVKLIMAILESILADEDKKTLPKRDRALLEESIFSLYNTCEGIPLLSDLKNLLESSGETALNYYSKILFSWTGETSYGRIIDRPTNIEFNKDLVTIELKGLDDYEDLQNALLLLFTDYIKRAASEDLSRSTLLIIDEAWKLFETKSGKDFTIEAYRTFRKFNSGIWAISQNYKDFLANDEIANSILPNTTHLFILKQRKIDWDDFSKTFDFNSSQTESIKGLELKKGVFSEFYYLQDENEAVLRLIPDPLSYWICSSDGHDKKVLASKIESNPEKPLIDHLVDLAKEN